MGLLLREEIGVRIRNKRKKSIIHRKVLHGPIMIICHRLGYNKLNSLHLRNNKSKRERERRSLYHHDLLEKMENERECV